MNMKEIRIVFDREVDGRWTASVKGIKGAIIHVYGATKAEAREKAKAAALFHLSETSQSIPAQISFVEGTARYLSSQ